jgi:hypothetical protein
MLLLTQVGLMCILINAFNLFIIEKILTVIYKRKYKFSFWSYFNLAPNSIFGYRKYYINIIGYLFASVLVFFSFTILISLTIFTSFYYPYQIIKEFVTGTRSKKI